MELIEVATQPVDQMLDELLAKIPSIEVSITELQQKVLDEVSTVVADIIIKTAETLLFIVIKAIETVGFVLGELDVHRELGRREALYREQITLLEPAELITGFFRGHISDTQLVEELKLQGYSEERIVQLIEIFRRLPDYSQIVDAYIRQRITYDEALSMMEKHGFSIEEGRLILDVSYRLLSPNDYVSLWLRGEISEDELTYRLKQHGYTDVDIENTKSLAYYIPPPPDLIRMAVREVFTPEIAEQYGLFEDFPEEFVTWAQKQGVSREWARNYWAAHWELPSATMGFEMLHRGIITEDELKTLLRALDVMPYWRDKLIQLSYNPLTRVDIRRMYQLGVIDRDEVYKAYLDIGYSPENAERMTRFTEIQAIEAERDLSKSELLSAFEAGVINETELREYLKFLKYADEQIDILIALTEYKREKKIKDARIKALKTKFINHTITESQLVAELSKLALSSVEIETYVETFSAERDAKAEELSVKELKDALKFKIITQDVFVDKMKKKGYNDEDISIIIKLINKGVT